VIQLLLPYAEPEIDEHSIVSFFHVLDQITTNKKIIITKKYQIKIKKYLSIEKIYQLVKKKRYNNF
jgi:hypothetical protein